MKPSHAVVVGGGIGGLSAAAGLHRIGWPVTVLERADTLREVGAGISLMPTARWSLDQLGAGDAVRRASSFMVPGGVRAPSGRRISYGPDVCLVHERGLTSISLLRAELQAAIAAVVPTGSVLTGAEVTTVTGDGAVGYRSGGEYHTLHGGLVVVADGINSGMRRQLWPDANAPAYSGHSVWQGATATAVDHPEPVGNTWGRGHQFGRMPLSGGRVGWYAVANGPPGQRHADERAEVLRRFGSWHAPIPQVIEATADVLHHDSYEMRIPLATFVQGRVAVLGDAAHPMTSDIGQGACQAIEDAVALCAALAGELDLESALRRYDRQRRPHTWMVTEASHRMGRMTMLEHPAAVLARNTLMGMAPPNAALRAFERVGGWRPPRLEMAGEVG